MTRLADYAEKYSCITFERTDGVLEMRFHAPDGGPLKWALAGDTAHNQFGRAFFDVGRDVENRVVIMTGTGPTFLTEFDTTGFKGQTPRLWDAIYKEGKDLLMNLLDIAVPVIAAINGPALIHAEIPLMSDIVLSVEEAEFADCAHMPSNVPPADGVHVWWEMLLGPSRARYFLLTSQRIGAAEAQRLGFVHEIVPRERLLARARELAADLVSKSPLTLRYARAALTQNLKRRMLEDLGYGLALEGLAAVARTFDSHGLEDQ